MIDWNSDGNVDPTEVVLTNIILDEDQEPEEELLQENRTSFIDRLIQKRRDGTRK